MYQCPAHDDANPSLHVSRGDRCALVHCFADCPRQAILAALGTLSAALTLPRVAELGTLGGAEACPALQSGKRRVVETPPEAARGSRYPRRSSSRTATRGASRIRIRSRSSLQTELLGCGARARTREKLERSKPEPDELGPSPFRLQLRAATPHPRRSEQIHLLAASGSTKSSSGWICPRGARTFSDARLRSGSRVRRGPVTAAASDEASGSATKSPERQGCAEPAFAAVG